MNETKTVCYESRHLQDLGIVDATRDQVTVTAPESMPVDEVLRHVRSARPSMRLVPYHIDLTGASDA